MFKLAYSPLCDGFCLFSLGLHISCSVQFTQCFLIRWYPPPLLCHCYSAVTCDSIMHRLLASLRRHCVPHSARGDDFGLLARLRRHPILVTCISSGLLYRGIAHVPGNRGAAVYRPTHNTAVRTPLSAGGDVLLYSNDGACKGTTSHDAHRRSNESRIDRLFQLRQSIEQELPLMFEKNLLELPPHLIDDRTVVCLQSTRGNTYYLR